MNALITDKRRRIIPEPFQTWAQLRREQCTLFTGTKTYALFDSFNWKDTPEGHEFWRRVDYGQPVEPHPSWGPQEPQEPLVMEDIFVGLK